MKYLVGGIIGILVALFLFVILFKDKISLQILGTPAPTASLLTGSPVSLATATPTASPSSSLSLKVVSAGGVLSFPKYEITIPSDWSYSKEATNPDMERLTLKNGSYSISILEGGFGGAVCLFPGDADVEGPSARFDSFKDIATKSGDELRRVASTGSGFGVCQKSQYGWGEPTSYGAISISVPSNPDLGMVSVVDNILSSITKK